MCYPGHLLRHVEEISKFPATAFAKTGDEATTGLEGIIDIAQGGLATFLC